MTAHTEKRVGRGFPRPLVAVPVAIAVLAVGAVVLSGRAAETPRGAIAVPNPDATDPTVSVVDGVRHVRALTAAEHLQLDTVPPSGRSSRLLFFQGQVAQPTPDGGAVATEAGGVVYVDPKLRVRRIAIGADGHEIVSVASAPDQGMWAVSGEGHLLRLDRRGELIATTRQTSFVYSYVASDPSGTAYLVRSPTQHAFRPVLGAIPLLLRMDQHGEIDEPIGRGMVPADFMLAHLASSGRVAIADSIIYFAPFIRDEVMALTTGGDTLWVLERGLPQAVDEPRFEVVDRQPTVDYAPVNTGIALGPDGLLYVLSIPGFSTAEGRVDVVDPASGFLLRSTLLAQPLPTLAADDDGRVYLLDDLALLTGIPPRERSPFSPFDLEMMHGGRLASEDLLGKVVLINFWASWCAPCRIEMPALDSLRMSIDHPDFEFLTFNEDITTAPAKRFLDDFGFAFPVALGRGDLRAKYHYIGLPFTVLIDRDGRVVERWIGYAGEEQLQAIRSVVSTELIREGTIVMDHDMTTGMGAVAGDDTMDHSAHTPPADTTSHSATHH